MSRETTLARVERDRARGDLGRARDRLHGLIQTYPNDLDLRRRLAEVYSSLRFPAMAGRYWYLAEAKTELMADACRAFGKGFHNDPFGMWCALKFRGDINQLDCAYAREQLRALQARCRKSHHSCPDFSPKGLEKRRARRRGEGLLSGVATLGCMLALIIFIVLALVGLRSVYSFIVSVIR